MPYVDLKCGSRQQVALCPHKYRPPRPVERKEMEIEKDIRPLTDKCWRHELLSTLSLFSFSVTLTN